MAGYPYSAFGGVPFDWQRGNPQRQKRGGVDYYTGTIYVYSQDAMDALWVLRAIVATTPVGDGTQRVYIDSWQPVASIQWTLGMYDEAVLVGDVIEHHYAELHTAILTELSRDERVLRAGSSPGGPMGVLLTAKAEFLLLS